MIVTVKPQTISTSSKWFDFKYWPCLFILSSLMNIVSKFGSAPSLNHQRTNEPPSPAPSPTPKNQTNTTSAWSVSPISVPGTMDTSIIGLSESQLRRQGLECLVAVLRSLVTWGTAAGKGSDETASVISARSQTGEVKRDTVTPEPHFDKLAATTGSAETIRQTTPDIVDDPTKFESAKQKKTTLLEGIKKFNYKPKRVSCLRNICLRPNVVDAGYSIFD